MADSAVSPSADSEPRRALRALVERGAGTSAAATMLRLVLLREAYPEAVVGTEVVRADGEAVVIRATIALPSGAAGSGIAAAHIADAREWAAAVERTETHAIARALDTLGHVLDAATPVRATTRPQAPTFPVAAPAPDHEGEAGAATAFDPEAEPEPEPEPEPAYGPEAAMADQEQVAPPPPVTSAPPVPAAETPPVIDALRRANRRGATAATAPAQPAPARATASGPRAPVHPDDDEVPLEDYSWTAFWTRARELGLDRPTVEQRIGRPIHGLTPLQLRQALEQHGFDFGATGS